MISAMVEWWAVMWAGQALWRPGVVSAALLYAAAKLRDE
jgi:hypothetical protein